MAAYSDTLPAKGFSDGFSSCAPDVVMARRVDQASKVAAPLEAMTRLFQASCFRRFSARNSATVTVMGLPAFRNAIGAGAVTAVKGNGASGSAALDSASG